MAVGEGGEVAGSASAMFPLSRITGEGRHEQEAGHWWGACSRALRDLFAATDVTPEAIEGLAVDGTSGTLVCLDASGEPLRPAIMYNDARSDAEADEINDVAADFRDKLGYRFAASYALAKILWVRANEPGIFERTTHCAHQADFIVGKLTGDFGVSDYSNALKTGYDLVDERWPEFLDRFPGVGERLPRVGAPGSVIGRVSEAGAEATGLRAGLPVVAGASDGTAAFLASGARKPGDAATTLGTTLVFKAVSARIGKHPEGLVYSHKLRGGLWLPGGASNTGAEWIGAWFAGRDPAELDARARDRLPADALAYPNARRGERFPFKSADAEGFIAPDSADELDRYAACLQGVAFLERLGYEVLEAVTGEPVGEVYTAGGGARSDVWNQLRADVTRRVLHRPASTESAFGAAVLAAAGVRFASVAEAVARLTRVERTFEPVAERRDRYDDLYRRWREEMTKRGWL